MIPGTEGKHMPEAGNEFLQITHLAKCLEPEYMKTSQITTISWAGRHIQEI